MKNEILLQLAQSSLLPADICAEIRHGCTPPISEIVMELLRAVTDAYVMTNADPTSTWHHRRDSRQSVGLAFLLALALERGDEPTLS